MAKMALFHTMKLQIYDLKVDENHRGICMEIKSPTLGLII